MPTYSYACTECGHAFDVRQAFSDDALTQCPQCGGRLRKLFGRVGVVFKGSGFYRTDSRGGTSSVPASPKATEKPADKPASTPAKSEPAKAASSTPSPAAKAS